MKKSVLLMLIVTVFGFSTFSQNTFNEGDKVLNAGLGIGNALYTGGFYSSSIPPVSASVEIGMKDELFDENSALGVGGYLGYSSSKYTGWGSDSRFSDIIIGARGALHYQFIENLDTYGGLMLGYEIVSWKSTSGNFNYSSVAGSGFTTDLFVGGRYYFSENFAGMLELGYAIAYLNIGIALKF